MITTLIYIVIPLLLLSLAGGLFFLLVDKGETGRKRTVYLLGLRVFCNSINHISSYWIVYRRAWK